MNHRLELALGLLMLVVALAFGVVSQVGLSPSPEAAPTALPAPVVSPIASPSVKSADCQYRHAADGAVLPDPACTPGAINPDVTQTTIARTICTAGWTRTVRPPVSYTDSLKRQQLLAYGQGTAPLPNYEEDHLLPLELGGAPADPANLWPEPGASPNAKDSVEGTLNRAVCSGKISLAEAQRRIISDWTTAAAGL